MANRRRTDPKFLADWLMDRLIETSFQTDNWEMEPVRMQPPTGLINLPVFRAADLIGLLESKELKWGDVEIAHAGEKAATWRDLTLSDPTSDLMVEAHQQGDTVVVNGAQHLVSWIGELCKRLEEVFQFPANANCYWTPAQSQGLPVHFDLESVLVIQLEGEKRWKVFRPESNWPDKEKRVELRNLGHSIVDCKLTPGDVLYLPRGFPHFAKTGSCASFHSTIALSPITWRSFFHHMVDRFADQSPELRNCLPMGFMSNRCAFEVAARQMLDFLVSGNSAASTTDSFIDRCFGLPYHSALNHQSLLYEGNLDLSSILVRRVSHTVLVRKEANTAVFRSYGVQVVGPVWLYDEFVTLSRANRLCIGEISNKLSDNSKLLLARRFLEQGVFEVEPTLGQVAK